METLKRFQEALDGTSEELGALLNTPIAELRKQSAGPLEAAELDLSFAFAINSLFWTYIRLCGDDPKDHPVNRELVRIKEYMKKVQQLKSPPEEPNLRVDKGAAKRFVKAALAPNEAKEVDTAKVTSDDKDKNKDKKDKKDKKKKENKQKTNQTSVSVSDDKRKAEDDSSSPKKKKKKKSKKSNKNPT
eukprot:m.14190 g.14190  ORF g.14190 m.14190 type:complete len:188 (+) comp5033_c0_seq2:302-865(+)